MNGVLKFQAATRPTESVFNRRKNVDVSEEAIDTALKDAPQDTVDLLDKTKKQELTKLIRSLDYRGRWDRKLVLGTKFAAEQAFYWKTLLKGALFGTLIAGAMALTPAFVFAPIVIPIVMAVFSGVGIVKGFMTGIGLDLALEAKDKINQLPEEEQARIKKTNPRFFDAVDMLDEVKEDPEFLKLLGTFKTELEQSADNAKV